MTPDPLPPLAEVFRKLAEPLEAKELSARTRKYTHQQLGSEPYASEAWEDDAVLRGNEAASYRHAANLAAPYDAELARLRARVAELEAEVNSQRARDQALASGEHYRQVAKLEAELAPFRELAREAAVHRSNALCLGALPQTLAYNDNSLFGVAMRLAALHKETPDA